MTLRLVKETLVGLLAIAAFIGAFVVMLWVPLLVLGLMILVGARYLGAALLFKG